MIKRFAVTVIITTILLAMLVSCDQEENAGEYFAVHSDDVLFLQFLNNEIPIIRNEQWEWDWNLNNLDRVYYSDISDRVENYHGDDIYSIFYIVDMDGDGNSEFCFYSRALLYIIKYDEDNGVFNLWLTGSTNQKPLGNGYLYYYSGNLTIIHAYEMYDKNANLVRNKIFTSEFDYYDEETDTVHNKYTIDWEVVSESEWHEEIAFLFELRDNGPRPLSYQDLLDFKVNN